MKIKALFAKSLLVCLCLSSVNCVSVFADEVVSEIDIVTAEEVAEPRAVSTGYKYTKINGVCFRRLWNYTTGEWVDIAWTRCPDSTHNH